MAEELKPKLVNKAGRNSSTPKSHTTMVTRHRTTCKLYPYENGTRP